MTDWASIYRERRRNLREAIPEGAILLLGNRLSPRNYPDNCFPFRQNSHLLYYCGINEPDIAVLIGANGSEILFKEKLSLDSLVWTGPVPGPEAAAEAAGILSVSAPDDLREALDGAREAGPLHYVAPYQQATLDWLGQLLRANPATVREGASATLRDAIIAQRNIKAPEEIAEIEDALAITAHMHRAAMSHTRPGITESEIVALIQQIALSEERAQSYNPIVTVRGEVLHNHGYHNTMRSGQLLLNDSGAESPRFYASDITRTLPVSGKYTDQQRAVYELVLAAQLAAIDAIKPGVPYRDIHLNTCKLFAEGLIDLGVMQGDPDEAVAAGAVAGFFVHGLGHMLGLDVHDMEDLGEDHIGYLPDQVRSDQFGLKFLRLARPLEEGFVVTVEPGIYFIPELLRQWQAAGLHQAFIRYDQLEAWHDFGGIRIEDDVLVTATGAQVLGPGIPRTADDIEALMG